MMMEGWALFTTYQVGEAVTELLSSLLYKVLPIYVKLFMWKVLTEEYTKLMLCCSLLPLLPLPLFIYNLPRNLKSNFIFVCNIFIQESLAVVLHESERKLPLNIQSRN